jgi:hypothetical protein
MTLFEHLWELINSNANNAKGAKNDILGMFGILLTLFPKMLFLRASLITRVTR